jgi:hypothetical protein
VNILSELTEFFGVLNIPVETGVFGDEAPDEYVVIKPLGDYLPPKWTETAIIT